MASLPHPPCLYNRRNLYRPGFLGYNKKDYITITLFCEDAMDNMQKNIFTRNNRRLLRSVCLALFVFLALTYNLRFPANPEELTPYERILARLSSYGFKGNLYVAALTALFWIWFRHFGDRALFSSRSLTVAACLFGLLNQSALNLFYRDQLPGLSVRALGVFLFQAAAWALLFLIVSRAVLLLLEAIGEKSGKEQKALSGFLAFLDQHLFFSAFLIILLGWLPWIISYYPASIEYDVYDPILCWLGEKPATNHHPWFYTMIVGSAWQLGNSLGDKNLGMFLYILIRDLFLAAVYARCIVLEKKSGLPRPVYFAVILFFAFTPVWGAYAKHAFKDTAAAGLFCWFVHLLVEILRRLRTESLKPGICLEFSAAVLLGCLTRNNTGFLVIPVSLVLVIICLKNKQGIKTVLLLLLGVFSFFLFEGYIFGILHVEKSPAREVLSIPFQQTARTVKLHGDQITEKEKEAIAACLDYDSLAESYDPIISDPVKNREHGTPADMINYLKVWAIMGLKYPHTYLEAFVAQTSGYYAFTPEYTEDQRYGPGRHSNVGMTIFDWVEDPRFPDWLNCHYIESLEGIRNILNVWVEIWHQIPILNLTDMKPMYTWVILLMGGMMIRRKELDKLLPIGACVLMILTCIGMPVNDCFRYYAPVAAAFPGLFMLLPPGYGDDMEIVTT